MTDIDIAADTQLREQAMKAVETYVNEHAHGSYTDESNWPISRAQITGLRQIAANEPTNVVTFAARQRQKAEATLSTTTNDKRKVILQAEIAYWKLVEDLCKGRSSSSSWSLAKAREQAMPDELREVKPATGERQTSQQQAARKEHSKRRELWQQQWDLDHYPVFFQRFCIHYIYVMTKRTQGA